MDRTDKKYPECEGDSELLHLIKAKYSLIYVRTWEEQRIVDSVSSICERPDVNLSGVNVWDTAGGLRDAKGFEIDPKMVNPEQVFEHIYNLALEAMENDEKAKTSRGPIFVLCDLFRFFEPGRLVPAFERQLKNLSRVLKMCSISIIIVSPELQLPTSLEKVITVVDYPLPGPSQLSQLVEAGKKTLLASKRITKEAASVPTEDVVRACLGLTLYEAEDAIAKAIVVKNSFDIPTILELKKQIIKKGQVLDYVHSSETLATVGGLEGLKQWIKTRKHGFGEAARLYGITPPKGVFVLGVQGTGKSLFAKAVANELQQPMLKLDIGRCFNQYVGASESNIRSALKMAESIAPCVLFVDELDYAMGAASEGGGDNGTSKRVIATLLDWMQEKTAPVFVVACANSTRGIPPAMLRRGRFDEMFFVDLPTPDEREEIFAIQLSKDPRNRNPKEFDIASLAKVTDGFSGAEIEYVVEEAMNIAFARDGTEFTTEDMLQAARTCKPLSEVMSVEIESLRNENKQRMRPAGRQKALVANPQAIDRLGKV